MLKRMKDMSVKVRWLMFALACSPALTNAQQATYSYDARGRLAAVIYDNGVSIQYSYDDNGNLLERQIAVIESSGSLQFATDTITVTEDSGDITINVQRLLTTNGAITVDFTTTDITAIVGEDYIAASGTLSWPDGDGDDRIITIVPINDDTTEPNDTFSVTLSNPTGGAELGAITTLLITLLDDDGPIFADGFEASTPP